jgi:predicted nucleotidyltransferase
VYGSIAAGTAWEKSDVDITVIVRDQNLDNTDYGIYEDNLIFGLDIIQRSDLKRWMEKSLAGTFFHALYAASKVWYTKDESLVEYFEELKRVGQADADKAVFRSVNWLLGTMAKVEKWLTVKNDVTYARFYVLKCVEIMAVLEVLAHRQVPTREAIQQAEVLNPELIETFYHEPMSRPMGEAELRGLVAGMERYLEKHLDAVMRAIRGFFGGDEIKTGTMVTRYFGGGSGMHELHSIFDYLCDNGYLHKVSQTIRITPKSKLNVEELAFMYVK